MWLWYGGNRVALPSEWKLEQRDVDADGTPLSGEFRHRICWKYGARTYNPSTKRTGGSFSCVLVANALQTKVGMLEGDVFNLASGKIPYVRKKCDAPDEFTIQAEYSLYDSWVRDCISADDK